MHFNLYSFFVLTILFTYSSSVTVDDKIKKDVEEIKHMKKKTKLTACTSLLRNSLDIGNKDVSDLISKSRFDASNTYEFIVTRILSNCVKQIKDDSIDKILDPENILKHLPEYDNILTIDEEARNIITKGSNLDLNEDMIEVNNLIKESSNFESTENKILEDEDFGILGVKLGESGHFGNIMLILGFILIFIAITIGLSKLQKNQREREEGKRKKKRKSKDEVEKED